MLALLQCVDRYKQFDPRKFAETRLGVEIKDFSSPVLLDTDWQDRVDMYRRALEGYPHPVAVHGACIDLNPASADGRIRAVTRERYVHSLEIAQSLGARCLVLHSQIHPAIRGEQMRQRRIDRQRPIWLEMADRARAADVTVVIENVYETTYRDLVRLVESIDSPHVKICLDVGHVKIHSALPIGDWVYGCARHLAYVHLHDNDGRYDRHLPPDSKMLEVLFGALAQHELAPVVALDYEPQPALSDEVNRLRTAETAAAGGADTTRR